MFFKSKEKIKAELIKEIEQKKKLKKEHKAKLREAKRLRKEFENIAKPGEVFKYLGVKFVCVSIEDSRLTFQGGQFKNIQARITADYVDKNGRINNRHFHECDLPALKMFNMRKGG
jgi:hypothetical protein